MKKLLLLFVALASFTWGQNPVVRQSRVVLLNAVSATGMAAGSAVLLPNSSAYGTLAITGSGITGSPSGCQVTLALQQSTGTITSPTFVTQSFTPSNAYQGFSITPSSSAYASGDSIVAVLSCSVYPGAGTFTVTFAPQDSVVLVNSMPLPANAAQETGGNLATLAGGVSGGLFQVNINKWAQGVLGAMANYGTSPGAVLVPGVNAFITNTVPVSGTFWQSTQPVSIASMPSTPVTGTFWQTTQPVSWSGQSVSLTGAWPFSGLLGSVSQSGTWTTRVVGNAGAIFDAAAGSTAAANSLLTGAVYNSSPPAPTTGQQEPLQIDSVGNLLVNIKASASIPVTGTFWQANQPVSGTFWQATQPVSGTFWQTTQPVSCTAANCAMNLAQVNGVTVLTGTGATGTGSPRVTVAQDSNTVAGSSSVPSGSNTIGKIDILGNAGATVDAAPGSAAPTNAIQTAGTDGTNAQVPYIDGCGSKAWTYYPVNVSSNTQIAAAVASTYFLVCQVYFPPQAGAVNVQLVEGTGSVCASSTAGLAGGATAALGANITANGGFIMPWAGRAVMATATANHALCIFTSAAVNGIIAYVTTTVAP